MNEDCFDVSTETSSFLHSSLAGCCFQHPVLQEHPCLPGMRYILGGPHLYISYRPDPEKMFMLDSLHGLGPNLDCLLREVVLLCDLIIECMRNSRHSLVRMWIFFVGWLLSSRVNLVSIPLTLMVVKGRARARLHRMAELLEQFGKGSAEAGSLSSPCKLPHKSGNILQLKKGVIFETSKIWIEI